MTHWVLLRQKQTNKQTNKQTIFCGLLIIRHRLLTVCAQISNCWHEVPKLGGSVYSLSGTLSTSLTTTSYTFDFFVLVASAKQVAAYTLLTPCKRSEYSQRNKLPTTGAYTRVYASLLSNYTCLCSLIIELHVFMLSYYRITRVYAFVLSNYRCAFTRMAGTLTVACCKNKFLNEA
jgi:hypothetical protein